MGTYLRNLVVGLATLVLAFAYALSNEAEAAAPDFLLQMPEAQMAPGSGAAELSNPRGIAADPSSGLIYVSDLENSRISTYTAWGLFKQSWGWDVAPDGAPGDTVTDELETCKPLALEGTPPAELCQGGDAGGGKGQLNLPLGLAVDSGGDVYVYELGNLRVQRFSPDGQFVLMFGGDVNQTKVGEGAPEADRNVCPVDPGDVCQAGTPGEGPSHLDGTVGDVIAYNPAEDEIVVGDKGRIQIFETDGDFKEEIVFEGPLAAFAGKSVNGLDVDEDGNIYFTLSGVDDAYKLSPAGVPQPPGEPGASSFEVEDPLGVAVDVEGSVYVIDDPALGEASILGFAADGDRLVPTKAEEEAGEFFPYVPFQGPAITAIATNICAGSEPPGNLYVAFFDFGKFSYVDAYGSGPVGCEPPPERPPEITAQFATAVSREEAVVRAQINPKFWTDTTYYVEYGTGDCSAGGCPNKEPLSPLTLTSKSVNKALPTTRVVLEGLSPATTYHFRFVAESSGGGPVFGVDPDGEGPEEADELNGLEGSFKTHGQKPAAPKCPNDAFRVGPDAELPDCRAYEMVSPLDKGNADVATWIGRSNQLPHFAEIHMSAPAADRFTFTSSTAFGDAQASSFASQYLAQRGPSGWSSGALMPPRTEPPVGAEPLLTNEFQGFSADLCKSWLRHYSVDPLTADAVPGYANVYRRENCVKPGTLAALSPAKPTNRTADRYFGSRVQGFSADGTHAIFTANAKLEGTDAPNLKEGELLLYEHGPEGLRFVCHLPNGSPISQPCAAGLPAGTSGSQSSTHNAISADGSRIFWSIPTGPQGGGTTPGTPGQIFVHINGADTVRVSGSVATSPAFYWTAADDGSKAIFEFDSGPFADQLYEFDVATETPRLIAGGVEGPMGASEDASRIYFASSEDLDDPGPATAGDHNLYLYEADPGGGVGSFTFIMELAARDLGGTDTEPAPIDEIPSQRSARVSPDGLHATFVSSASPTPTGFDNRDAESGEPAQEVYLYDAAEDELRCVSCNATGARPAAEDIGPVFPILIVARIQGWEANNHAPHVLTNDGTRVFFESFEALVPRDTNATWDVYQWEEPGKGSCKETSETFSEVTGGCVELISSGQSPVKSTFLDADPSGNNIFFSTQSSLVAADYGLNDVYVARVGGGFPDPVPQVECEGEACQSPPPPPPTITPASESFRGADRPKARKCPKGKRRVVRKGKVRCVKRRGGKAKRQRKGGRR
jgi:NHL repeat